MKNLSGLSHLFATVFLHYYAVFMVVPAITDVTMAAICPGENECSLAIYLTGFQQTIIGVGSLVMMPLVGNLSDKYGRKPLLALPMALAIIPLATLAYSRTRYFFYAYYVLKTLTSIICDGSINCLALAYVADNVAEGRRATAFGVLSGIGSSAFVCGTFSSRFLSTDSTFKVSASVAFVSLVYMKVFLQDSIVDQNLSTPILSNGKCRVDVVDKSTKKVQVFKTMPSLEDMSCLLRSSVTFTQAAVVAFFSNLTDVGLHASLMYYLKAKFHFNKDQFADLMVISGVAGTFSQLILLPILAPLLGEGKLLSLGLFFTCAHTILYSIAWSSWVPYAASMFSILFVFTQPCMRTIVSKQVGSSEQGKAQGCISGIGSIANVISPLLFSPLTDGSLDSKYDDKDGASNCRGESTQ
ncbi:uncharacterized protein [Euphorbia lathyris]|uniref:uncharacterized protein isoform X2 n=1 Tax=Euphorbia lathyris TaxID=212925 RepID=UPI0033131BB2